MSKKLIYKLIRSIRIWQVRRANWHLCRRVQNHTLLSPAKLGTLARSADILNVRQIEGDFVECGVAQGGSAGVLAAKLGLRRHLWLFDSFERLPRPSVIDGKEAEGKDGTCASKEQEVIDLMSTLRVHNSKYTIRKGWFNETFADPRPQSIALLHCDADWYESVLLVLRRFYPCVAKGGIVVLDDFGSWQGCREAFYDYCGEIGEKPLLERVEYDQAYWIKGRKSNRFE